MRHVDGAVESSPDACDFDLAQFSSGWIDRLISDPMVVVAG